MCKDVFIKCIVVGSLLPVLLFLGCAKKVPIFQSPGYSPDAVNEITVFPVVDLRFEKSEKITMEKVDKWMLSNIDRYLKSYGYKVNILTDRTLVSDLTEDDLSSEDAGWIKQAAPENSNWILITGLVDCMAKMTFGSTGNAEVTGYFYNKAEGSIIWHDKGVGMTGQGGLIGMALKGMMVHDAVKFATLDLMSSFPAP